VIISSFGVEKKYISFFVCLARRAFFFAERRTVENKESKKTLSVQ
jgi:hypothetical protein